MRHYYTSISAIVLEVIQGLMNLIGGRARPSMPGKRPTLLGDLSDEIVLHVVTFLEPQDIAHLQATSRRYLRIGRDNALWKLVCFDHSRAEALRQRQRLLDVQDSRLAELRNAVTALPGASLTAWDVSMLKGSEQPRATADPVAAARAQRLRALTNWEPGYPGEKLNYYTEYIHRHADIHVGWLDLPKVEHSYGELSREATGLGLLSTVATNQASHAIAPLDDGSVCIWDVSARSTGRGSSCGKLRGKSRPGLLTGLAPDLAFESHAIMTETGSVECVSIDQNTGKAYFAVQNLLHEVDLSSLEMVSTKRYPWPITALSANSASTSLVVGTNWTIHLHDPRDPAFGAPNGSGTGELIGGSIYSHATLSQPGPLSILSHAGVGADGESIWVAGRFTSLLNYDRRFFPRLRGTIHSGARIASLSALKYPLVPQTLDLVRSPEASLAAYDQARSSAGTTMIAAAEYKGKGSLELYGLPRVAPYQNRQTASASKLLSAVPHGGRIVFSDGDGNLKWVERDGFTIVRSFNINSVCEKNQEGMLEGDASAYGIWSSTGSELPGQGDIVQKILPMPAPSNELLDYGRWDVNQSNLLLWTGDGRLGMLGFGHHDPVAVCSDDMAAMGQENTKSAAEMAREDAERQHGAAMRRQLQRNADEVRFLRGLGMSTSRRDA